MGGAAVVVAGVTECVALVLDESVVFEAEADVLEPDVDDIDGDEDVDEGDEGASDEGIEPEVVSAVVAGVEVEVMVVSVVSTAEDTAEDTADDAAEEDIEAPAALSVDEPELTAVKTVEAADTEIKLPPLLNSVTVVGCPLTTTVETVTVLSGPVLLPIALLDPLAELPTTLVCKSVLVVCPNENE
jgi:hypothetical protein